MPSKDSDPPFDAGETSAEISAGATVDALTPPSLARYTPPPLVISRRYEVLEQLGAGGMGIVYKARDKETAETVAVKVLRPEVAADARMSERFKSELRLARAITHKNVCRIFDFNRFDNVACISMELVEGESLRRVLERFGTLSVPTTVKLALQICEGMKEAHRQGIVHRDLKPENVMLDAAGDAKVMDFGIAHSGQQDPGTHGAGTPAYMSPEQVQGRPTDERTDVYALGLILYEVLKGRAPFSGGTVTELLRKQIEEMPAPIRDSEATVPEYLDRIVLRCLEKDPARRFQTMEQVQQAIRSREVALDMKPAEHLGRWNPSDWVLVAAGVIGIVLAYALWDKVLPGEQFKLEVDAIAARREAVNVANRLGIPTVYTSTQLEFHSDAFHRGVFNEMDKRLRLGGTLEAIRRVNPQLFWRVRFASRPLGRFEANLLNLSEGYALVTRQGKVVEISRDWKTDAQFLPLYKPPPAEQRRAIAESAVRDVCGPIPPGLPVIETAGGRWQASYEAEWKPIHPPGSPSFAAVELWAERPIHIACADVVNPAVPVFAGIDNVLSYGAGVFSAPALFWVLFWFGMGQCYASPNLRRRLPIAAVVGAAGGWVLPFAFPSVGMNFMAGVMIGFLAALLTLIAMLALEYRLLRVYPQSLPTWLLAARGRFTDPAIGLAVLRGALAGIAIFGLQIGISCATISLGRPHSKVLLIFAGLFYGIPEPGLQAAALTTFAPALFVVAASLFTGIFLGLGYSVGFCAMDKYLQAGRLQGSRAKRWFDQGLALFGGCSFPVLIGLALRLPFARTFGIEAGILFVPYLFGVTLIALLWIYDQLTVMFAIATTVLWILALPLLTSLSEVGNGTVYAVLAGWCALVLAATALAFRPVVTRWIEQSKVALR